MCAYGFHVTSPKGNNYDCYLDNKAMNCLAQNHLLI